MINKLKTKYRERKNKNRLKKARKRELFNQIKNAPSAYDNAVISWTAPEYTRHEKGLTWKLTALAIVIIAAIFGIFQGAWTFSLATVVFAGVYYLFQLEHPRNIEIKISDIGIKVGSKNYPYGRIKAFWIIYEPPFVQTLNIRVNGEFLADITIQLNNQDPALLREFLISKIPEIEGKGESLSDALLRLFKI